MTLLGAKTLSRAALAVVCVKIAAVMLFVDPGAFLPFSHVKALMGYGLTILLLGLLAALVIAQGRAVLAWSPLHAPAALFAIAYVLAAAFALDLRVGLTGAEGRSLGLFTILDALVMYLALALLVPRWPGAVLWVFGTLAGAIVVEAAVEALQLTHALPLPASGRPYGTAGNADPLGVLMAALAAGAIGVAAAADATPVVRWSGLGVGLLALLGWIASGTRAPLAGLALTLLGLALLWALSAAERRERLVRIGAIAAVAILAAGAILVSPVGSRLGRIAGSVSPLLAGDIASVDKNVAGRLDHYRASLNAWWSRPILGVGPDNYTVVWPDERLPGTVSLHKSYAVQTSTHGWFFKLITDAGTLGLIAFIGALVIGLPLALRRRRDPWTVGAAATLVAYLAGGALSPDSAVTVWLPWLSLGLIAASAVAPRRAVVEEAVQGAPDRPQRRAARRRARRETSTRSDGSRTIPAAIAVAAGAILAFTPYSAWQGSHDAAQARSALATSGQAPIQRGADAAQRAVVADPRQPPYWGLLGLAQRRAGHEKDALAAFKQAAALAPWDVSNLLSVAQSEVLLAGSGDDAARADALATMQRAVATDPFRPDVHFGLALALFDNKRYDDAIAEAEHGRALDASAIPDYAYELVARSYLEVKKPADAQQWCELGLSDKSLSKGRQVTLHVLSASALLELGRRPDALEQVNAALALDPSNQTAQQLKKSIQAQP